MSSKRMKQRGISFDKKVAARLENYRIVFNVVDDEMREPELDSLKGYANIEFSKGEFVEGFVYSIDCGDLKSLDNVEAGYERKEVVVAINGIDTEALTYTGLKHATASGLKPPSWYMNYLIKEAGAFSHDYLAKLKSVGVIEEEERQN